MASHFTILQAWSTGRSFIGRGPLVRRFLFRRNKSHHDRFEWTIRTNGQGFLGEETSRETPVLEVERPCNMRSNVIARQNLIVKNVYDRDGSVAINEVYYIGRKDDHPRSVNRIATPPELQRSQKKRNAIKFQEFINYTAKILRALHFKKRFTIVGIDSQIYDHSIEILLSLLTNAQDKEFREHIDKLFRRYQRNENLEADMIELTTETIICEYPDGSRQLKTVRDLLSNMTIYKAMKHNVDTPHMKRNVYLHIGPTNSGKTYGALEALKKAKSGIYCGPLRLLAREINDKLNTENIQCSLITGEEQRESFSSSHWSTTVEMAQSFFETNLDVAVIDEAQMISDPSRGFAWTSAIINLQVNELHICGEPSICKILVKTLRSMGDEVNVKIYERLMPLVVSKNSLNSRLEGVMPYDCIVAFKVSSLFVIKKRVEELKPYRCAVIYGGMPPESRAEQIRLLNSPNSPFKVLVATDAIGMGLNLNIRRIIFFRVEKYDGKSYLTLPPAYIKQISGRAGRFSSDFKKGEVSTFFNYDMPYLKRCLRYGYCSIPRMGITPTFSIITKIAKLFPKAKLSDLFEIYRSWVGLSNDAFLCTMDAPIAYAKLSEHVVLSLRIRYKFAYIPVSPNNFDMVKAFHKLVSSYATGTPCRVDDVITLPKKRMEFTYLKDLEACSKILSSYSWLSVEFPHIFFDTIGIEYMSDAINRGFNSYMMELSGVNTKREYEKCKNLVAHRMKMDLELIKRDSENEDIGDDSGSNGYTGGMNLYDNYGLREVNLSTSFSKSEKEQLNR